jgi:hypothetical protein
MILDAGCLSGGATYHVVIAAAHWCLVSGHNRRQLTTRHPLVIPYGPTNAPPLTSRIAPDK